MLRQVVAVIAVVAVVVLTGCAAPPDGHESSGVVASVYPAETEATMVDPARSCKAAGFPTVFDKLIKETWLRGMGQSHAPYHCRFRAQVMLESSGRADAKSKARAVGLVQQIPEAADDCRKGGLKGSRMQARFSVACAVWHRRKSSRRWIEPRPVGCRIRLEEICYVSGCGNADDAQDAARARGYLATCPYDGIDEGLRLVLRPDAAEEAVLYPQRIDALALRMRP